MSNSIANELKAALGQKVMDQIMAEGNEGGAIPMNENPAQVNAIRDIEAMEKEITELFLEMPVDVRRIGYLNGRISSLLNSYDY